MCLFFRSFSHVSTFVARAVFSCYVIHSNVDNLRIIFCVIHMKFSQKTRVPTPLIFGLGVAALLLGSAFLFFRHRSEPVTPVAPIEIRFGGIVPLSGNRSAYGVPIQRAAQLAIDEINARGGILGQQVEIQWRDGKCDANAAAVAAQKLIEEQRVQVIFGGVCSLETLAVAPLAEERGVLVLSPSSTSAALTDAGSYIFRLAPSDALIGSIAASYARQDLHATRIAIISEDTQYVRGIREAFVMRAQALGAEIVFDRTFKTGDRNSAALVSEAEKATPDLIYLLPESQTQGLQQLLRIKRGSFQGSVLVAEVLLNRELISQNKEAFEGVYGVEGYFDANAPKTVAFLDSYRTQFAEDVKYPFYMSSMYDAVYLIKEAVEQNGTDTAKMRDWLLARRAWDGASGQITFDANGDPLTKFSVLRVKEGELGLQKILDATLIK